MGLETIEITGPAARSPWTEEAEAEEPAQAKPLPSQLAARTEIIEDRRVAGRRGRVWLHSEVRQLYGRPHAPAEPA